MPRFRIRKEFKFEAAHVLVDSFSECCQTIHGHSYVVEVFLGAETLDPTYMVMDFGQLKEIVSPLIDGLETFPGLDHSIIIPKHVINDYSFPDDTAIITWPGNPTAESMAQWFYECIAHELEKRNLMNDVQVEKVRVHETKTGWAEYGSFD